MKEYDGLVNHISNIKCPANLAEAWKQDHAEARRIISVGREASKTEIERLLSYERGKTNAKEGWRRESFEKDKHLQQILKTRQEGSNAKEKGNGCKKIYGWGRMAHNAEKGMMADKPLTQGNRYMLKHATRSVRAIIEEVDHRLDVNTLHRNEEATHLGLNDIGVVQLRLSAQLPIDSYRR